MKKTLIILCICLLSAAAYGFDAVKNSDGTWTISGPEVTSRTFGKTTYYIINRGGAEQCYTAAELTADLDKRLEQGNPDIKPVSVSEAELKASSATTQEQTFRNYMDTTYQQGVPIPRAEDNQPKETSETPKESKSFLKKLSDFLSSLLFFL